jgi:hypothetical protein
LFVLLASIMSTAFWTHSPCHAIRLCLWSIFASKCQVHFTLRSVWCSAFLAAVTEIIYIPSMTNLSMINCLIHVVRLKILDPPLCLILSKVQFVPVQHNYETFRKDYCLCSDFGPSLADMPYRSCSIKLGFPFRPWLLHCCDLGFRVSFELASRAQHNWMRQRRLRVIDLMKEINRNRSSSRN